MAVDRRQFFTLAAGVAGWYGCGAASDPSAPAEQAARPWDFVPYVVGANTAISGLGFFEAIDLLAGIGYPAVEVQNLLGTLEPTPGQFPGFRIDRVSQQERERIVAALEPFEYVTAHLPYSMPYIDPQADDAVAEFETTFDAAALVGAKVAVLHPQPHGTDLLANWSTAVERIRKWGSMAADRGFRIAVETGAPPSVPDCVRLLDEIGHDNVGSTLDVGHQARFAELAGFAKDQYGSSEAVRAYNDVNLQLVDALGDKLIHFHVHDIEPATWAEHKPLIHGFIDYPRLIAKLRETEYGGVLIFEIGGDADKMPGYLRDAKSKLEGYLSA